MTIFTPINQVKLTNVSIVRLKKHGKRFEVACYKNKILDWKNKLTKQIDQVLQTETVFSNVSKGQVAKKEDLSVAFPGLTPLQILEEILSKGEVQLGEKERDHQIDSSFKEIARIVSEKCVNPSTQRLYSAAIIEKAMNDAHFSVNSLKSTKQQALEVIKLLQAKQILPLKRALMKIMVTLPEDCEYAQIYDSIQEFVNIADENKVTSGATIIGHCEPGAYREICELVSMQTCGKGNVVTLLLKDVIEE